MSSNTTQTELKYECEETTEGCSVPKADNLLLIHGTDDGESILLVVDRIYWFSWFFCALVVI